MCVCPCAVAYMWRLEPTDRSGFSSTRWVTGIKLKKSGLVACAFTAEPSLHPVTARAQQNVLADWLSQTPLPSLLFKAGRVFKTLSNLPKQ